GWDEAVLRSALPVAVAFWADWCVPCAIMAPALEWASAHFQGRLKIGRLNVDEHPGLSRRYGIAGLPTVLVVEGGREAERRGGPRVGAPGALPRRYGIAGLPTVLVVEGGREAERRVGLMDSSALVKLLARHVRDVNRSP